MGGSLDDGYFPRHSSVLRRVQEERAVGLMFGQRALCIGALKPLNYVGTSEHTRQKLTPFRRLAHTGKMFETVFFGTRAEADRTLEIVDRMHQRVHGVLPEGAGSRYPAGTPYSALDGELMLWTIAVAAESALLFYELLVAPLDAGEREGFWQDYVRFGELFGMPRDVAPASYPEFRAWWDEQLAGDDLYLTEEALYIGAASAFEIPMPRHMQLSKRVHDLIMLGSMPPRVRELYDLPWTGTHETGFKLAVAVSRAGYKLAPRSLRRGYNSRYFDLVAETERRRIAAGKPTPQVVDPARERAAA